MLRGEADLALPQLYPGRHSSGVFEVGGGRRESRMAGANEEHPSPLGVQPSAYMRLTLSRLAAQVNEEEKCLL